MKKFFFGGSRPAEEGQQPKPDMAGPLDDSFLTGDEIRDRKNIKLLLEAIGEVSSTLSLEALLIDIVDKSIELARAERGILFLVKEKKIHTHVARDAQKQALPKPVVYSTTLVQQVARTQQPIRKMVSSDSEAMDLARSVFDLKLRAVMCAPLMVKDELLGMIYVDSKAENREFSRIDLTFFYALSRQLAIAIQNARLVADSMEKARLEKEMAIAGEIQRGLLPGAAPQIQGLDLFGWYAPCEDATGDYYEFLPLAVNKLALILCDVSGHGIGPALLTATARAALRSYLRVSHKDLGEVMDRLNQDLERDLKPGMFMTLFVGIYDCASRNFQYINAGHPSPILARGGKNIGLLPGFEPAFGFRLNWQAKTMQIKLEPGDLLFVYSDGLTEARTAKGELYGEERLLQVIKKFQGSSTREIVEAAVQTAKDFSAQKQGDDITVCALRILPT